MEGRGGRREVGLAPAVVLLGAIAATTVAMGADPPAQPEAQGPPRPPKPWTNATELSLVQTEGNSSTSTFGFKETLEAKSPRGRSRLKVDALRSDKSDDAFLQVEPGIQFQPGETPTNFGTRDVHPAPEPDVERYFIEARTDRNISKRVSDLSKKGTWNAGASWDRNQDAGILNRYIAFAGFGSTWVERDDRSFRTTYGFSWTYREEEIEDPEKETQFPGARLTLDFMDKWGASTTYDDDLTYNINLRDGGDYFVDWTQGVAVSMAKHLALKISLQFQYSHEPALENVDVIARVMLVDPDGIPGDGDEFFETVDNGGIEITLGEDPLRKRQLDSTFRSSLLINF